MPALVTGKAAPDFTLPTMQGHNVSLAEARRRGPVVVAFLKSSCPVCQYAFPFLERLHRAYDGKNVAVIGISQNDKKTTAEFLKQYGITFPVLLDDPRKYEVSNAYGLTNVPTFFLVSPQGDIEISSVGWSRSDIDAINNSLAQASGAARAQVFRRGEEVAEWRPG